MFKLILKKTLNLLCIYTAFLILTACGGGGGDGGGDNEAPVAEPPQFVDITSSTGINFSYGYLMPVLDSQPEMFAGGVAAGDYDNDGDIDLFIVRGDIGPNLLYANNGSGVFTDVALSATAGGSITSLHNTQPDGAANYRHSGPTFADIDGDGDLDLFIGGMENDPSFIFSNQLIESGQARFLDVTPAAIANMNSKFTVSAAFGDYDLDGDLDMMLAHWGTPRTVSAAVSTESLWRNDGGFDFTDVTLAAGIAPAIIAGKDGAGSFGADRFNYDYSFTPTFARITADVYPDILSVADFRNTRVFISDAKPVPGPITFTDVTDTTRDANGFVVIKDDSGMGSAVGDYDNDGDLDWFISAIYGPPIQVTGNRFYRNNGGVFEDFTDVVQVSDGGWGWGACMADFNDDRFLDIAHTNGWSTQDNNDRTEIDLTRLFMSDSSGTFFVERGSSLGIRDGAQGRGIVCADFDNDGDIDIFETTRNMNASIMRRNELSGVNYLKVKLVGDTPNTEAAGARIRVSAGGVTQMREIMIGSNFVSQNPTVQHFGLGTLSQVNVSVEWPSIGGVAPTVDNCNNVAVNQTITWSQTGFACP